MTNLTAFGVRKQFEKPLICRGFSKVRVIPPGDVFKITIFLPAPFMVVVHVPRYIINDNARVVCAATENGGLTTYSNVSTVCRAS